MAEEEDPVVIEEEPDNVEESNVEDSRSALEASQGDSSESNSTCMICMEEWTIGSEHRVCCLKCGHLFGRSCIERWIKEKGAQAKCPTCNKSARKADLRDLWCKSIKANDDTELMELQRLLEQERKLRKTDSAVIFHQNLKLDLLQRDLDKLKQDVIFRDKKIERYEAILDRINKIRAQQTSANEEISVEISADIGDTDIEMNIQPRELKGRFHFAEKVVSSSAGGCRTFALCPTSSIILVAQPNPAGTSGVFGGYGLRKYSTIDTNVREFIPLHSKLITSIQLKPIGDLILTASQDKKVRLTSISNNSCVQAYNCAFEPTSVAWSAHRDQQFYVGSSNCFLTLYDIRNTSEFIYQTSQRVANTRLLSIASTTGENSVNGLLVNDSKGSQFLEISDSSNYDLEQIDRDVEHLTKYQLPFDGLMGTVDFHKPTGMALITTRRSNVDQKTAHNLVKLRKEVDENGSAKVGCERARIFSGSGSSELLSQTRILKHPTLSDQVLVGACDEGSRGIKLWDASDNTEYQCIRTDTFVRDMLMYTPENSNQHVLYTLSDNSINIYRWDYA